jgi:PAS domain S-box-containing protein
MQPERRREKAGPLYQLLVESVVDYAIFALDRTGHVLSWNRGAERLKGYTASEIIGQHFSVFYPRDVAESGFPARELEEAARTGSFEDEGWRVRKDGSRFWANVVITALHDDTGAVVGFAKVTRDLTDRKTAEENTRRLVASEAARLEAERARDRMTRLQAITSKLAALVTPDRALEIALTETVETVGAAQGMLYVPTDDQKWLEIVACVGISPEVRTAFNRLAVDAPLPIAEAVRNRQVVFLESNAELARYPAASLARAQPNASAWAAVPMIAGGRLAGALALGFANERRFDEDDRAFITALAYQAAQALERSRLYLAQQEARAEAEHANKAKVAFLATMSHELRTPLNAIGGYAQLLELGVHGDLSSEQADTVGRIRRSEQRLRRLIEDILIFARIEAGRLELSPRVLTLHELIADAEIAVRPQMQQKRLTFSVAGCDPAATAFADADKVQQILINLVANAIKFTPEGGEIALSTARTGRTIEISVRDTGVGIPPEKLQSVFEPFVQIQQSPATPHEGAGLGLTISRNLARAMDGDLTVSSEVGVGSVFRLSLPSAEPAPTVSARPNPGDAGVQESLPS